MEMKFLEHPSLVKHENCHDGYQYIFKFDNNYGASVVKHHFSYGGPQGFYELAVIKFNDAEIWEIVYDTPITYDVLGWLTVEEVLKTLENIKQL